MYFFNPDDIHKPGAFSDLPTCLLCVYNRLTNTVSCLNLPIEQRCRVNLVDKDGHQVTKTAYGQKFDKPLLDNEINKWLMQHFERRSNPYLRLYANGIPKYDIPADFGRFAISNIFEIKEPGEYELHVEMRLVQAVNDSSEERGQALDWYIHARRVAVDHGFQRAEFRRVFLCWYPYWQPRIGGRRAGG
jgi:hypothetical protein